MSPEQARKIALSLPEAVEGAHMRHPDFRGWGRRGSANVALGKVDSPTLRTAMTMAWRRKAPKRLVLALGRG